MKNCPVCKIEVVENFIGICPNEECTWEFEQIDSLLNEEAIKNHEERNIKPQNDASVMQKLQDQMQVMQKKIEELEHKIKPLLDSKNNIEVEVGYENEDDRFGTFTDTRDGQIYKTVKIGKQIWMAQNLNFKTEAGSWCYDDREINALQYGRLYNWETAMESVPKGWHLPSDVEWDVLIAFLGWDNVAGGELKEAGTLHWISPNTKATNGSGFGALPGGFRFHGGTFDFIGGQGYWWSATKGQLNGIWGRYLNYSKESISGNSYDNKYGFSVRCVCD